ncbi:MAG: hypothetical protein AAF847_01260 [Bacteroidota bacterium]
MLRILLFTLCAHLLLNHLTAQTTHAPDTIPFTLSSHNNIIVQSVINGQDTVDLMFHTASDLMTLTEAATATMTSMKFSAPDSIQSWGGGGTARFSVGNVLQIGEQQWDSVAIVENKRSGPMTGGKFGLSFFTGKMVELNFDLSCIVLHQKLPSTINQYQQLPLSGAGAFLFLEGQSRVDTTVLNNRFLIHTGYGGTILYDDAFVAENNLGDQLKTISEQSLKDAYGNVLKTKKSILPSFFIGAQAFEELPVGFFEGSIGRQKMSVIGGDLLKRFNIIFDTQQAHIYLKANELIDIAYSDL